MFDNKYSKVLTVVLIVVIIGVIGLLIFFGIDVYRKYYIEKESTDTVSKFEEQINNTIEDEPIENNNVIVNDIDPIVDENSINENTSTGGSSSGGSSVTYKGYTVIGTIEIPKTNIKYPILDQVSIRSLEASIGYIYGQGLNQVGNAVLVGHNYRNGTFFSNNKKLEKGDKIYITDTSGKKVTYIVYKKYETSTSDFSYATRNVNGKREISLSTCTDDTKKRLIIWAAEQ